MITRQPVTSSNLVSVGYDPDKKILEVEFKGGSVYQYLDVPLVEYQTMMAAASVGSYLAANIKGKYEYRKTA